MNRNNIEKNVWTVSTISEIGTLGLYAHNVVDVGIASKITLGLGSLVVGMYFAETLYDISKNIMTDLSNILTQKLYQNKIR